MEQLVVFGVVGLAVLVLALIVRMPSRKPNPIEGQPTNTTSGVPVAAPNEAGTPSPVGPSVHPSPTETTREAGSVAACVVLGLLLMGIGFYFLLNPTIGDTTKELGMNVANLQLLDIGETCTIAGAIFLAAGLRPRRLE